MRPNALAGIRHTLNRNVGSPGFPSDCRVCHGFLMSRAALRYRPAGCLGGDPDTLVGGDSFDDNQDTELVDNTFLFIAEGIGDV